MNRACADCGAQVRDADLLVKRSPGNVDRRDVLVDADDQPADFTQPDGLLLCLGRRYDRPSAVVVPLDDPGAPKLAQAIVRPHAHRLHVCPALPSAWLDEHTAVPV